jgi:HSP20 family protein
MAKEGKEVKVSKGRELEQVTPSRALNPFEEMERYFDEIVPRHWMRPFRWDWPTWGEMMRPIEARFPRVDVIDREKEVLVRAEVPGVDKKDLEVTVSEDRITIKGKTRREVKEEKGDYFRSEISSGSFSRTLALPCGVESDKADASYKDGTLEIKLPKLEKAKRKTVEIK